jgi:hypothetical protein
MKTDPYSIKDYTKYKNRKNASSNLKIFIRNSDKTVGEYNKNAAEKNELK